jgi:hypothetical protein
MVIVFLPQQVLEKDFQRDGQAGYVFETRLLQLWQAKNIVAFAPDLESFPRSKTIYVLLRH